MASGERLRQDDGHSPVSLPHTFLLGPLSSKLARSAILRAGLILWTFVYSALAAEEKSGLSQVGYYSQEWTVDDGLPHNIVNCIVQDPQGYLWIASLGGLVRFDGRAFKEYPLLNSASEPNYNIRDLVLEPSGSLALLPATGGVLRLKEGKVSAHPAEEVLKGKASSHLFVEPNGALWIDADGGELVRWYEGKKESFYREKDIPAPSRRCYFACDPQNRVWISTGNIFGYYEKGRLIWRPEKVGTNIVVAPSSGGIWVSSSERLLKIEDGVLVDVNSAPEWRELTQSSVHQLFEDRQKNLWIATRRKGLLCITAKGIETVQTSADNITSILQDAEDNIWIGTHGGGISRLRPKPFISLDNAENMSDSVRTSLCEDSLGALWFANRRGTLARYYNGAVEGYTVNPTGRTPEMYLVCPDKGGLIWVCTSAGLYTISSQHPTQLEPHPSGLKDVRIMICAQNGDIWVVHGEAGVGFFHQGGFRECVDEDNRLPKRIAVLAEAPDGTVWLGSNDRTLLQYKDGKFIERYSSQQVPGGPLKALLIDPKGTFWLATTRGIVLKQGERFKRFGVEEGLSDELISQLLEDDRGRLWSANRRGFSAVALEDFYAVAEGRQTTVAEATLGKDEGLPKAFALSGLPPTPWKAQSGRLWFSTHGGFIGIDPGASLPRRNPPAVYIDVVEVDHRQATLTNPLRLQAGDHQLTFKFTAINFSSPGKVQLRHQLIGYDLDWVTTGTDRTASYVYLPPGTYRMRVTAKNQDGRWNENGADLALIIPPTWWQTWYFRLATGLAIATVFAWLVRHWSQRRLRARLNDLERERQLERERARIARDLHDELGYSVTQVGLIADRLKNDSSEKELREGLGELASCTRRLSGELDGVVWTVSPKNDKWDRLATYIRQFALNFFADTSIACTVEGGENAPALPLAPEVQHHLLAIIKETLNNILKHARATRVEVSLSFVQGTMMLHLVDNGIGFAPSALEHSERNGLTNLRARAQEIGGQLEIVSSPGRGTEVRLSLAMNAKPKPRSASVS